MSWVTSTNERPRDGLSRAFEGPAGAPLATSTLPRALWTEEPGWGERRVLVVEPDGFRALGTAAAMEGYLWIPLEPPRPAQRGKLALYIEESIETALQARGAPPPGVGASADLDASLGDQLYRARLVEMRGVALGIPNLGGIANLGGVLDAEDSAALRWWAAAALDRPVRVVLSAENYAYRIYPSPVAFSTLLDGSSGSFVDAPSPRAPSAETAQSVAAMELSDLPPAVAEPDPEEPLRWGADIELPELDQALGLEPAEPVTATDPVEPAESVPATQPEEPAVPEASVAAASSADAVEATEATEVGESAEAAEVAVEEPGVAAEAVATEPGEPGLPAEPAPSTETVERVEAAEPAKAEESSEGVAVESNEAAQSELADAVAEAVEAAAEPASAREAEAPVVHAGTTGSVATEGSTTESVATESSTIEPSAAEVTAPADAAPSAASEPNPPSAEDQGEGDVVLTAVSSPVAPEVAPTTTQASALRRPMIKSSISLDAARRAAAGRRPFIMSAEDADAFDAAEALEAAGNQPGFVGAEPQATTQASADASEAEPAQGTTVEAAETTDVTSTSVVESTSSASSDAAAPSTDSAAPSEAPQEDPFDAYARQNWQSWVRELEAARGPKPLAVIERLFVTAYTRLDAALERGIADESARSALLSWRSSFSKSYAEAFDALRVRGKRPTMVLDIPEVAQRIGRLHGARRVQLLLVDGMRFDLGMRVQDRLKLRAEASLTERLLLWSALPTTTTQQLELIGKGPDGLKEMSPIEEEAPAVVARGKAAHTLRRIRTGRRELLKLDIVEAALREGTSEGDMRPLRERMPKIADDVAVALSEHFAKQAPRTLIVVFGDHGFTYVDNAPTGQEATQGGSSPEEVLVPAFAWLTGATH